MPNFGERRESRSVAVSYRTARTGLAGQCIRSMNSSENLYDETLRRTIALKALRQSLHTPNLPTLKFIP